MPGYLHGGMVQNYWRVSYFCLMLSYFFLFFKTVFVQQSVIV